MATWVHHECQVNYVGSRRTNARVLLAFELFERPTHKTQCVTGVSRAWDWGPRTNEMLVGGHKVSTEQEEEIQEIHCTV